MPFSSIPIGDVTSSAWSFTILCDCTISTWSWPFFGSSSSPPLVSFGLLALSAASFARSFSKLSSNIMINRVILSLDKRLIVISLIIFLYAASKLVFSVSLSTPPSRRLNSLSISTTSMLASPSHTPSLPRMIHLCLSSLFILVTSGSLLIGHSRRGALLGLYVTSPKVRDTARSPFTRKSSTKPPARTTRVSSNSTVGLWSKVTKSIV
mmetsp:Transcript_39184/g.63588  ORF Transcript_39184/g.63588 Transcript_39184/m.63588 type:complete len:209 (+) Transcript_39184:7368-7994(+)